MAIERLGQSRGILGLFTRHRTLANLLMVILLVSGVVAATNIRSQFFPDTVQGTVSVTVAWPGAGPEDVDAGIVQLLDPALLVIDGVDRSTARSREGRAEITLEFAPGWDMARATEDVQAAVDMVRNLPDAAERPEVRRTVWRDRVTDVVITGPLPVEQLALLADELTGRLFAAGVTRTTVQGVAAPDTLVTVPTEALLRHGLALRDIATAIAAEVQVAPAGDVSGGLARVRTGAERRAVEDIAGIVLRRGADGTTLTLRDVATVERLGVDRRAAYFVGDNPAMTVRVDRAESGDAIALQAQVQAVAQAMQATLPQGATVELIRTRAENISARLELLLRNGALGLGLVVLLLFLFLNARTAFWVAAGIPVAMSAAIAVMYAAGLTINMISLFALIITLGIVVDDAIVVGEHADHRARNLNEAPPVAAENAARRMFWPVLASTLTTIIAFAGLTMIDGRMGAMIRDIPFTVIAVLAASLVECFLILPNHMAHAIAGASRERWYDWPSRQVNRGFRWVRSHAFRPLIGLVIRARYPVLALAVLALASQAALFVRGDVQWRFFNAPEQGSITGNFSMLNGADRAETIALMRELQRATAEVAARFEAEHGRSPVSHVMGQVGGNMGRNLSGAEVKDGDLLGSISIELIDPDLRPYSSFVFLAAVQDEVRPHPKMEELSFRGWRFGGAEDGIAVQLSGQEAGALKAAAEALKRALAPFPQVSALEDTLSYDKPEFLLTLTPQGEAMGFSVEALGRALRDGLSGVEAASFPDGLRSATIRVELPEADRTGDFLDRMLLRSPSGAHVPLSDLVTVTIREGFSTVRRENGLRVVTVTGELSEDDPAAAAEVQRLLGAEILPRLAEDHGVAWRLSGAAEEEGAFLSDSVVSLALCLLGIYIVLCWIFASWTRPLVVMAAIPFGLVGAIWGHYIWDVPLSMFSIVGLIGMAGIIINDSIVLIGTVDEHARTRPLHRAIMDGAADRLRPVLLTTLTTVLGLSPLLYESSSQALFLKPTVITLAYGLGFGMVLVLVVIPALMAAQADLGRAFRSLRRGLGQARRMGVPGLAVAGAMAGLLVLFAGTLGVVAVTGALPGPLEALRPGAGALATAALLFAAGSVAVVALAGLTGAGWLWLRGLGSR